MLSKPTFFTLIYGTPPRVAEERVFGLTLQAQELMPKALERRDIETWDYHTMVLNPVIKCYKPWVIVVNK